MGTEEEVLPPLTPDQSEMADALLDMCGLSDVADHELEMRGSTASVRYGLGICAVYLQDRTPDEIKEMVHGMLNQHSAGK